MLSKISYVMLWTSCVNDTDSIFFSSPACGIHRNVLTIQNSSGTYTHKLSRKILCTIGHIQLFTSLIACTSKGPQNYSFHMFVFCYKNSSFLQWI